ncbi:MAG: hypothetical protein K2X63_03330, partial [Burkholderiaceae bacterium]|nr:hypothetical protein [Burkholderiaceae bacterium]
EDEKRLSKEMHADMRSLRNEIAALRKEIKLALPPLQTTVNNVAVEKSDALSGINHDDEN